MIGINGDNDRIYEFGDFRIDAAKRLLTQRNGEAVPLMPKAFDTLLYLVRKHGKIIEKDELMAEIWPDTIVEENNLTQNISILRRVFGEKPGEHRFVATIPGVGYKFVADVREVEADPIRDSHLGSDKKFSESYPYPADKVDKGPSRFWLATLGLVSVLALTSLGFYLWRDSTKEIRTRSIAVLPFKPLVAEDRNESLELGMADSLITRLGSGEGLTVRPLSAVRRFNALDQDSIEAGLALGVDTVLEGSIQTSGDRVRVSAKLFRISDSKQLWAGQFDENLKDIFIVQDSISERVSDALQIALARRDKKRHTENVEAYQLYMKGKFHAAKLILPEVQKGISYYEQAIAVDPNYALAYTDLAYAYRAMVLTNDQRPREIMPKAKAAVMRAIELDGTLAEAYAALAYISFWYDFDVKTAERYHRRALELDPKSPQSRFSYAHLSSNIGRHDEALVEIKRARELDPISLVTNALEGQILAFAGRDDEAIAVLERTIEMEPNFWLAHLFLSRPYLKKQRYAEAAAAASRARELSDGNAEATATVAFSLAKSGKTAEARSILAELDDRSKTRYVPFYALAQLHLSLGDHSRALDLLEKSFEERDSLMVFLKVDSKWDSLRAEPRFIELTKRMNFE